MRYDFINAYYYPKEYVIYQELDDIIIKVNKHDHLPGNGVPIPHGIADNLFAKLGMVSDLSMSLLGPDNHHAQQHYLSFNNMAQIPEYDQPHKTQVDRAEIAYEIITPVKTDLAGIINSNSFPSYGKFKNPIGHEDYWESADGYNLIDMVADHVLLFDITKFEKPYPTQDTEHAGEYFTTVADHVGCIGEKTKVSNVNPHGLLPQHIKGLMIWQQLSPSIISNFVIRTVGNAVGGNDIQIISQLPLANTSMRNAVNTFNNAYDNEEYWKWSDQDNTTQQSYKNIFTYHNDTDNSIRYNYYMLNGYPLTTEIDYQEQTLMVAHTPSVYYGYNSKIGNQKYNKKLPDSCIFPMGTYKCVMQDSNLNMSNGGYTEHGNKNELPWKYIRYWQHDKNPQESHADNEAFIYDESILLQYRCNVDNLPIQTDTIYPINTLINDNRFIYKNIIGRSYLIDIYDNLPNKTTNKDDREHTQKQDHQPADYVYRGKGIYGSTITAHDSSNYAILQKLPNRFSLFSYYNTIDPLRTDMRLEFDMRKHHYLLGKIEYITKPSFPNCSDGNPFPGNSFGSYNTNMKNEILPTHIDTPTITISPKSTYALYKYYIPEISKVNNRKLMIDITATISESYYKTNNIDLNLYKKWFGPLLSIDLWKYETADGKVPSNNTGNVQTSWSGSRQTEKNNPRIKQNHQFFRFIGTVYDDTYARRGIRDIKILGYDKFVNDELEAGLYLLQIRLPHREEIDSNKSFYYYCWNHENKNFNTYTTTEHRNFNEVLYKTGKINPLFGNKSTIPPCYSHTLMLPFNINITSVTLKIGTVIANYEDGSEWEAPIETEEE